MDVWCGASVSTRGWTPSPGSSVCRRRPTADDLVPLRVPESRVPADAVRDPSLVEGATLRRAMKRGEPLRLAHVLIPPLVQRGDRVRMVAVRGAIRITASGEALAAAARGQTVRVRNLDSQRVVVGRVVGPGAVEMPY